MRTNPDPEGWIKGDEPVDKDVYGVIRAHRAYERANNIRRGYAEHGFDIDKKFTNRVAQAVAEELCRGAERVNMACRDCATTGKIDSCNHKGRLQMLIVALPPIDWDAKMPQDDKEYPVLSERIQELLEET